MRSQQKCFLQEENALTTTYFFLFFLCFEGFNISILPLVLKLSQQCLRWDKLCTDWQIGQNKRKTTLFTQSCEKWVFRLDQIRFLDHLNCSSHTIHLWLQKNEDENLSIPPFLQIITAEVYFRGLGIRIHRVSPNQVLSVLLQAKYFCLASKIT